MTFAPTPQQTDIFQAIQSGSNVIVTARAGTGKTTTIVHAVKLFPQAKQGILAFNKKIAEELKIKLDGLPVEIKTLNAMGFAAWREGRKCNVDLDKKKKLLTDLLTQKNMSASYNEQRAIIKLVDSARIHGLVPKDTPKPGAALMEDTPASWSYLQSWADTELGDEEIQLTRALLCLSISRALSGYIDLTDQLYMPTIFGALWPIYDLLYVDEAQDLSPLNHKMVRMIRAKQKIIVGDALQSIYAFRGAMTNSMDLIQNAMANTAPTVSLPLSVTFRCGHAIVARQLHYVPDYEAHASNPPGEILHWENEWSIQEIPDGAAILCRNNAPLISMALHILASHRPVHILGRDFAEGLKRDIKKAVKDNSDLEDTLQLCRQFYNSQLKRNPTTAQVQMVEDKTNCIQALAGAKAKSRDDLLKILDAIFSDDQKPNAITLATAHKAKGLEWTWVMHLNPQLIPSKYAKDEEALTQENNIRYVLETRPSHTLCLASLENLNLDVSQ